MYVSFSVSFLFTYDRTSLTFLTFVQFSTQTPTLRILKSSPNRVVISSPGDIAIWRPLAEAGFPVYSQELVLTGMLKQEVDWEGVGMRVAESV